MEKWKISIPIENEWNEMNVVTQCRNESAVAAAAVLMYSSPEYRY